MGEHYPSLSRTCRKSRSVYSSGDGGYAMVDYSKETSNSAQSGLNGYSSSIFMTRNLNYTFAASQSSHVLTVLDRVAGSSYPLSLPGAYRVSVNFSSPAAGFFVASVDNFFHYNFGDVFALGAGIEVGLAFGGGWNFLYVGPVIQPAIIKLGDRGQHQLAVTASIAVVSTYNYNFRGSYDGVGTFQMLAGYSYFF